MDPGAAFRLVDGRLLAVQLLFPVFGVSASGTVGRLRRLNFGLLECDDVLEMVVGLALDPDDDATFGETFRREGVDVAREVLLVGLVTLKREKNKIESYHYIPFL